MPNAKTHPIMICKRLLAITIALFALLSAFPVSATAATGNSESSAGLGGQIEAYIEERAAGTASVVVAVYDNQETIYETYYGHANIEEAVVAAPDTVYEWGSVTKLLTWVSVMQQVELGKIDLNQDIRAYLPDNFLTKLQYDEPITMLHLMNHTAGFQETVYTPETNNADNIVSLEQALLQSQPSQIFKPGDVCSYSNWGVSLAAFIVERVSERPFDEYVRDNIFEPLKMEHTALRADWSDNAWVQERRQELACYSIYEDSFESLGSCISYILLYPAGSATGTLDDFVKFGKALIPAPGQASPLFKNPETLSTFLSPTSYYADTEIARVCHGMWTMPYGNGVVGHSGNTSGCSSSLYFDPVTGTGVAAMTNEVAETAYNYGLLSLIFGEYRTNGSITAEDDISGIYTSARAAVKSGFGRIYKYIGSFLPLQKTADPGVYSVALGSGTVTQLSDNLYMMDNGNGLISLMVKMISDDGTVKFETFTQDIFLESNVSFFARIAAVLLFVLAVLYSAVMLVINALRALYKLIKKKPIDTSQLNILRLLTYLAIVVSGVLVYTLVLAEGYVVYGATAAKCIALSILALVPCVYGVTLFRSREKQAAKRKKVTSAMTVIAGLLVLGSVIYWQWFNFWSL